MPFVNGGSLAVQKKATDGRLSLGGGRGAYLVGHRELWSAGHGKIYRVRDEALLVRLMM